MENEVALPAAEQAQVSTQPEALETETTAQDGQQDGQEGQQQAEKKEKTPEERERARMQRALNRKHEQLAVARAELEAIRRTQQVALPGQQRASTNADEQDEDQPVQLTKKQLAALIKEEGQKLAPQIKQEQAIEEHRRGVAQGLAKKWGQEKFQTVTSELDDALGGMSDQHGRAKPCFDAIMESDDPAGLVEYLADPDNAEEAEALGRMGATQAGRAVAKLEAKLQAKAAEAKAEAKPQPSNAPKPLERIKGSGSGGPPDASSPGYMDWKMKQLAGR